MKVDFELPKLFGERVAIVGDFNGWDFNKDLMVDEGERWVANLEIEEGRYQYKYLVDNKLWLNDPKAETYVKKGRNVLNSLFNSTEDKLIVNKEYGEIEDISTSSTFDEEILLKEKEENKSSFTIDDKQIYIYHSIVGCLGEVEITYVWSMPDRMIYDSDSTLIQGYGGEQRLYNYINLFPDRVRPGMWKLFILINGELLMEKEFLFKSNFYAKQGSNIFIK